MTHTFVHMCRIWYNIIIYFTPIFALITYIPDYPDLTISESVSLETEGYRQLRGWVCAHSRICSHDEKGVENKELDMDHEPGIVFKFQGSVPSGILLPVILHLQGSTASETSF